MVAALRMTGPDLPRDEDPVPHHMAEAGAIHLGAAQALLRGVVCHAPGHLSQTGPGAAHDLFEVVHQLAPQDLYLLCRSMRPQAYVHDK